MKLCLETDCINMLSALICVNTCFVTLPYVCHTRASQRYFFHTYIREF